MVGVDGSKLVMLVHSDNKKGVFFASDFHYRKDLFEYLGDGQFRVKKPMKINFKPVMYANLNGMNGMYILKNGNSTSAIPEGRNCLWGTWAETFAAGDVLRVKLFQEYDPCVATIFCTLA